MVYFFRNYFSILAFQANQRIHQKGAIRCRCFLLHFDDIMTDPSASRPPFLSLDESIKQLKAEIISQDWRVSKKRAELLTAAFACLKQRFKNRKRVFAIIVMANNVLLYIQKKGDARATGAIDFLKEAMAHVVTSYEDSSLDPEKDKKIFNMLYGRFNQLKDKIQAEQLLAKEDSPSEKPPPTSDAENLLREAAAQSLTLQRDTEEVRGSGPYQLQKPNSSHVSAESLKCLPEMDQQGVEDLVRELKDSLQRAEDLRANIRQLLDELLSIQKPNLPAMDTSPHHSSGSRTDVPAPQGRHTLKTSPGDSSEAGKAAASSDRDAVLTTKPCEKTPLFLARLGEQAIAIEEQFLAARKPLPLSRRSNYLKNSTVPLKDFSRLLHPLSSQFKGCLSSLRGGKLRSLYLPIITPRGLNLPDKPEEGETEMLVLCNGNWCGILFCTPFEPSSSIMVGFQPINNGDLSKTAVTEKNDAFPLLNTVELLKREGHMVVTQ
jgi:hypothetical protein